MTNGIIKLSKKAKNGKGKTNKIKLAEGTALKNRDKKPGKNRRAVYIKEEHLAYEEELKKISLSGKKSAVFGPGDSEMYPDTFCDSVDILEKRLRNCGAEIIVDSLKVDGDVEPKCEEAKNWGKKIGEILKNG